MIYVSSVFVLFCNKSVKNVKHTLHSILPILNIHFVVHQSLVALLSCFFFYEQQKNKPPYNSMLQNNYFFTMIHLATKLLGSPWISLKSCRNDYLSSPSLCNYGESTKDKDLTRMLPCYYCLLRMLEILLVFYDTLPDTGKPLDTVSELQCAFRSKVVLLLWESFDTEYRDNVAEQFTKVWLVVSI